MFLIGGPVVPLVPRSTTGYRLATLRVALRLPPGAIEATGIFFEESVS